MKRLLIALASLALAASAGAYPIELTIKPAEPTHLDPLELHMDVMLSTPCYEICNMAAYRVEDVLHLDYETYDPGLYACIQIVVPAEFVAAHDPLPPGTYPVVVRERQFVGPVLINEFWLYDELTVTGTVPGEVLAWSQVKAIYR
jgi:hypothetical protein